jgi:hypothetical protein
LVHTDAAFAAVHTTPVIEQVPVLAQSFAVLHEAPVTLHVPGSGVHCDGIVHDAPLFWLCPQTALLLHAALLPTEQGWPTRPCVQLPLVAAHCVAWLAVVH